MKLIKTFVLLGSLGLSALAQAETVIVVNPENKDNVSMEEVSRIFLGKMMAFPSGQKVTPINQPESSSARAAFDEKALEKNASQLKAYWSKQIFTGKGNPPAEMDAAAVKQKVASDRTAIGYIDASALDGSVREVARF